MTLFLNPHELSSLLNAHNNYDLKNLIKFNVKTVHNEKNNSTLIYEISFKETDALVTLADFIFRAGIYHGTNNSI